MSALTPERIARIREQMRRDIRTSGWKDLCEELLDRVDKLEAERDRAVRRVQDYADAYENELSFLRARVEALTEALRRIANGDFPRMVTGDFDPYADTAEFAAKALAVVVPVEKQPE